MKQISFLFLFVIMAAFAGNAQETMNLSVGSKAPVFKTIADNGKQWNSKKYFGKKNVVIYFYPSAMTGGCTKQACAYRDFKTEIDKSDAVVVGVSGNNVEGLKLFKKANNLNFTLLSDEKGEIAKLFGVPTKEGGKITREIEGKSYDLIRGTTTSRWTFIIDKNGKIAYKNEHVNPEKDTQEVLDFISKNN